MPKTRSELLAMSADWAQRAKEDIRAQIENFMSKVETSEEELAYALGIPEDEMHAILSGDGSISLETFAKILIATEHALAIQPIEDTPMGNYRNPLPRAQRMPPLGRVPSRRERNWREELNEDDFDDDAQNPYDEDDREWTPPTDRFGNPLPVPTDRNGNPLPSPQELEARGIDPMDFMRRLAEDEVMARRRPLPRGEAPQPAPAPAPEEAPDIQPRDSRGRFMPRPKPAAPARRRTMPPLSELSWGELSDLVRTNLWDGEINLHTASHKELVDFLTEKERRLAEAQSGDGVTQEFKDAVEKACGDNPELLAQFHKMFPEASVAK